ncbi:MAG: hypothetical protein HYZ72_11430 [Deltaproteobacteria bacterium]|nr:hypothetical protein [Deltaproteobacteria bacterium]
MDLKNPAVWSVMVAALAVVLSQLPPVREMVKGRRIRIVIPEQFMLYHYLGNVQINLFLVMQNIGGKAVSIAKIDCIITDGGNSRWDLPAHSYYSRLPPNQPGQSPPELLLGWIPLKPGEHWSETLHCFKFWSTPEERRANEITAKIRNNIVTKRLQLPAAQFAEADAELITEAKDFFRTKFNLSEGNYQLVVAALAESDQVLDVRGCEFTLFESSIRALQAMTEEYKYGAGVYYPTQDLTNIVYARVRPIDEKQARQTYEKLRSS